MNIKQLENKIKQLESRLKKLEEKLNSNNKLNNKPANNQQNTKSSGGGAKGDLQAQVNQSLQAVVGGKTYTIDEETIVNNRLVMGDSVLIVTSKDTVKSLKVAQKAKREVVEALVTQQGNDFYAVSKYATHKLTNYDIKTKGVLKGFEVNLLLPKDKEEEAKVVVIDSVESSHLKEENKKGVEEDKTQQKTSYDPRVIQHDDLV